MTDPRPQDFDDLEQAATLLRAALVVAEGIGGPRAGMLPYLITMSLAEIKDQQAMIRKAAH